MKDKNKLAQMVLKKTGATHLLICLLLSLLAFIGMTQVPIGQLYQRVIV